MHTSDPDRAVRLLVPALNGSSICNLDGVDIPALLLLADSNVMYCKANHRGRGILHACISCAFLQHRYFLAHAQSCEPAIKKFKNLLAASGVT